MEQKIFTVGETAVGGINCEVPTVLIGSIFYMRHKIVKDDEKGIFDEIKAAETVNSCEKLAEQCGVKFMLDVVGNTPEALINYITFLKKTTDAPLLLNSTSAEVRTEALLRLSEKDMLDNIIYNSINAFSTDKELKVLEDSKLKTSIVQAYNVGSKKADGPLKALQGTAGKTGMLTVAKQCGIENIMVDIPTLDMASIGLIVHSAGLIKEELGLVCGTASSNATYASEILRNREVFSKEQFRAVDAAINGYLAGNGFNFLFYGPVEGASWVFPSVAAVNGVTLYGQRSNGAKQMSSYHPILKML